jgi:hypothetical protein
MGGKVFAETVFIYREETHVAHRHSLVAMLALFVLGLPVAAQDKADLKWKFEKDKTFYQTMTTETTQQIKVMNMDMNQKQNQTFYFSWTTLEQDKDKNWIIRQKIDGVKMDIEIGGNKISYDSTNPGTANNPLSDFFKALVGSEFKITLNPDMKVTRIEGRDKFLEKLVGVNPQMKPLLDQLLSDEALKQMAEASFSVVPNKEEKKGGSWKRDSKLNLGPIGTWDNTYEYTLNEIKGDLATIGVKTTMKYERPGDNVAAGLPFRIKSADLKTEKADGTIQFNTKAGRVESVDMSQSLKGKLSIEIGTMTTEVELSQTQKTTVKTSDKDPIEKK